MAEETQNQQQEQTDTGKQGNQADTLTLSKDDFNKRLDRAKRAREKELLTELGIESLDALKAKLTGQSQQTTQTTPAVNDELKSKLSDMESKLAEVSKFAEDQRKEAEMLKTQRRNEATLNALRTHVKALRLRETVAEDIIGLATITGRDLSKLLGDDLKPNTAELKALEDEMRTARPDWFKAAGIGIPATMAGGTPTDAQKKAKEAAALGMTRLIKRGF